MGPDRGDDADRPHRMVMRPSPDIASRALTTMLTSAVSNWLGSASTRQGPLRPLASRNGSTWVSTWMREPVMVRTMSETEATPRPTSNTSGWSACRRAKARSWPVSLAARSTVSEMAST